MHAWSGQAWPARSPGPKSLVDTCNAALFLKHPWKGTCSRGSQKYYHGSNWALLNVRHRKRPVGHTPLCSLLRTGRQKSPSTSWVIWHPCGSWVKVKHVFPFFSSSMAGGCFFVNTNHISDCCSKGIRVLRSSCNVHDCLVAIVWTMQCKHKTEECSNTTITCKNSTV